MLELLFPLLILAADSATRRDHPQVEEVELRRWDFEEADDAYYDDWPDGWTRRQGPGYPRYLEIGIVTDSQPPRPSGSRCLRMDLDGGAALVSSPPVPINPQFSYVLEAAVKTVGLKSDEAYVSVSFCDRQRRPLETHESKAYRDAEAWTPLRLGPIAPSHSDACWAIVGLHLVPRGEPDLTGAAMFDDLRFRSVPRVALTTNSEHNLYTRGDDISVTCRVSGLPDIRPQIQFELLDMHGRLVARSQQALQDEPALGTQDRFEPPAAAEGDSRAGAVFSGEATWQPAIPENGFYQLRVSLPGHAAPMVTNLAVAESRETPASGEFGWSLPAGDAPLSLKAMATLLARVGIHWVKFPVWYDEKDAGRAEELARFAERLSEERIQLVGMLDQPPPRIRELLGETGLTPVASRFAEPELWRPTVDPVMTRLSLKVRWWQLGGDLDTSFVNYPGLESKVNEIRRELHRSGREINLGFSWRTIDEPPRAKSPPWSFISYRADPPLTADELQSHLSGTKDQPERRWVLLEPLPRSGYDLSTRARDLVLRMLAAKIGLADGVFVPDPFHPECGLMAPEGTPGELLLPWRTTALMISGAQYLGSMQMPGGSRNHLFVRGDEAIMAVWNDRPVEESMYLGDHVQQVDLWDRARTPRQTAEQGLVQQMIEVGELPTFVTGLNPFVARWRTGFQFETQELASVFGQKQAAVCHFQNTFPQAVAGELVLHAPAGWEVEPTKLPFQLAAGEIRREVFHVLLGADVSGGRQPLRLDFDIAADRNYRFSVFGGIQVGLGDVEMTVDSRLDEEGNLMVEQHLTNKSHRLVSFNCLLFVPERRRERRQVFHLGHGRMTNVFLLPDGQELVGKTLWLRAEEIGGARILNHHFTARE